MSEVQVASAAAALADCLPEVFMSENLIHQFPDFRTLAEREGCSDLCITHVRGETHRVTFKQAGVEGSFEAERSHLDDAQSGRAAHLSGLIRGAVATSADADNMPPSNRRPAS